MTIDIDNLTLGQIKQLKCLFGANAAPTCEKSPFETGKAYIIRTVTMAWTGRVQSATAQFVTLTEAAWIPDTGRFNVFVESGKANEVEPVRVPVIIGIGTIVDAMEFKSELPRDVK